MKVFPPLLLFSLLFGCMRNTNQSLSTEAMSENNIYNLSRISVGMSEREVFRIMRHPYSERTFEHEGDIYDIWFYVTRVTGMDQSRMLPQNLTPLTFKNGVLIGWGFAYYNYLIKQEEIRSKAKKKPPEQQQHAPEEDIEIEKALQTPPGTPSQEPSPSKPSTPEPQKTEPAQKKTPPQAQPAQQPAKPTPQQPAQKPLPPSQDSSIPLPQPPPAPVQPVPQQPPSPVQPEPGKILPASFFKRPANGDGDSSLVMCSRPASSAAPSQDESQEAPKTQKEKPYLDEEGEEMIEQENEQNFDFW